MAKSVKPPASKEIPRHVLEALNTGTRESANLAEALAVDFIVLLLSVHPDVELDDLGLLVSSPPSITERMRRVGQILSRDFGVDYVDELINHPSDTVRSWAAYVIGLDPYLKLRERLKLIRALADDSHFGVREWAWMPLRPHIAANIEEAIKLLKPWTRNKSPYLRRFAVEATRPRGVWTAHIERLKQDPQLGLPLLEPLRADPEKYVQDAVSNWLNDAAKSQPEWVREVCATWSSNPKANAATARICRRALRTIDRD